MGAGTHTPGPWHVEDDGSVQHESGMVICVPSYAEDFPCLTEDEDKSEEEVRAEVDAECAANAALIAASPDLLDALKLCVIRDKSLKSNAMVMAALAKAEANQAAA